MGIDGSVVKIIKNKNKTKTIVQDRIYYAVVKTILFFIMIVLVVPIVYVLANSLSNAELVATGRVFLWPKEFTLEGYEAVFKNRFILIGYGNTIFYAIAGTSINLFLTIIAAWPLSRKDLPFNKLIMLYFVFTMIFNGGLIPNYLLIRDLKLIDTRWALLLPMAINVYNMIICRTFFRTTIPQELRESANIDGCSELRFFASMVIPLSKAVVAVIGLYYAVFHWNAFFNAFLYINNRNLYPLQLVLREILLLNTIDTSEFMGEDAYKYLYKSELIKYSLILVACVPIWCLYPFVQKFFVKGVMIGSIKG